MSISLNPNDPLQCLLYETPSSRIPLLLSLPVGRLKGRVWVLRTFVYVMPSTHLERVDEVLWLVLPVPSAYWSPANIELLLRNHNRCRFWRSRWRFVDIERPFWFCNRILSVTFGSITAIEWPHASNKCSAVGNCVYFLNGELPLGVVVYWRSHLRTLPLCILDWFVLREIAVGRPVWSVSL